MSVYARIYLYRENGELFFGSATIDNDPVTGNIQVLYGRLPDGFIRWIEPNEDIQIIFPEPEKRQKLAETEIVEWTHEGF